MSASTAAALIAGVLVVAAGQAALAQEGRAALGGVTYALSCAVCHGAEGTGQSAVADDLTIRPPDLTHLAARNGGTFPRDWVSRVIAGGAEVTEHGGQMPAWGMIFLRDLAGKGGDQQALVRQRIADLVAYIESIQVR